MEQQISILLNEYDKTNERIESYLKRQDTIIQIGLTGILALIALWGESTIRSEVLIIVPFISLVLASQILYEYNRALANQFYRGYIQSKLNEFLPKSSSLFYNDIGRKFLSGTNPVAGIKGFYIFLVHVVALVISIKSATGNSEMIFYNVILIILTLFLGVSYFYMQAKMKKEIPQMIENSKKMVEDKLTLQDLLPKYNFGYSQFNKK